MTLRECQHSIREFFCQCDLLVEVHRAPVEWFVGVPLHVPTFEHDFLRTLGRLIEVHRAFVEWFVGIPLHVLTFESRFLAHTRSID